MLSRENWNLPLLFWIELTTDSTKLSDLPESYQDYSEYICEVLHTNGIYDTTKVNRSSAEFISYTSGNSSLQDFLKYLDFHRMY